MKSVLKFKLYMALVQPLFYATAFFFNLVSALHFFYAKNFFGGGGSSDLYGFFTFLPVLAVVAIPVLQRGMTATGTETPVFLAPLSPLKKILSDYLALFIQTVLMTLPQFLLPLCVNLFGAVDSGQALCGFFMLFLYFSAASALAVLFSVLIESEMVALLCTVLALALSCAANLFVIYAAGLPLLERLLKAFSFLWHFESAGKGIFDSRDAVFFVLATAFFCAAAFFVSERKKGALLCGRARRRFYAACVIFVLFALDFSRLYVRHDVSLYQRTSVSSYSRNLLRFAEGELKITYFKSGILSAVYPQAREVSDFLHEFASSVSGRVIYSEVDAEQSESLRTAMQNYGITGREFRTVGKNRTEYVTVYSSVIIEYQGSWDVIPFILSSNSLEYDLDIRILSLLGQKRRVVNVLCGNARSLTDDYSYVVPWLNSQGFVVNELRLDSALRSQLEADGMLVVLGSRLLTEEQCAAIDEFLERGGVVFAAASPYSIDIENSWAVTEDAEQPFIRFLERHGLSFTGNLVSDISCARILMQSDGENGDASGAVSRQINYPEWISVLPQQNSQQGVVVFWPAEIAGDEKIEPVLFSSPAAWLEKPDFDAPESLFVTNPFYVEKRMGGIEKKAVPLAFRSGALLLIPDQYFVHSLTLGYIGGSSGDYRNLDFLVNALLRLSDENELSELQQKAGLSVNRSLFKVYDDDAFRSARRRTLFCMFIFVPLCIGLCYAGIAFRRKSRWEKC